MEGCPLYSCEVFEVFWYRFSPRLTHDRMVGRGFFFREFSWSFELLGMLFTFQFMPLSEGRHCGSLYGVDFVSTFTPLC